MHYVVDCEWTDWINGTCTKTCGGGKMIGNRTHEKSAANGGQNCTGPSSIEDDCNIQDCPGFRIFLKKYLIQPIPVQLK